MRALGRDTDGRVQTLVVPDERHGFALFENQVLAAQATYDFLAQWLNVTGSA